MSSSEFASGAVRIVTMSAGCRGRHCSAGVPGEPTEKERKEIGAGAARRRERNANTAAARYRVATGRTVVIQ